MKKLVILVLSLTLTTGFVLAQDTTRPKLQVQKRDRIHQEDHLMCQDGQLYQWQQGERKQIQNQVKLKNGTVCNPDGTCQLQNGNTIRMRNGECMDMAGNRFMNQRKFNQNRMMNQQQMNRNGDGNMNRPNRRNGRS